MARVLHKCGGKLTTAARLATESCYSLRGIQRRFWKFVTKYRAYCGRDLMLRTNNNKKRKKHFPLILFPCIIKKKKKPQRNGVDKRHGGSIVRAFQKALYTHSNPTPSFIQQRPFDNWIEAVCVAHTVWTHFRLLYTHSHCDFSKEAPF